MRIFLTGATGFVGSHVARELIAHHHTVAALIRPASNRWRIAEVLPSLVVIDGDVPALHNATAPIRAFLPDAIIHTAWQGVASGARNDTAQIENIVATTKLVELAHTVGCRTFIGLGSQAEYGIYQHAISEDMPANPVTMYGAAKLSASILTQRLCELNTIRCVWLRLFSAYGPADNRAWLLPYVILSLLRGETPALTAGTQMWDYIFVEDVARAIHLAAANATMRGVYNIGSGEIHSIRTIVEQARDLIDSQRTLGFGQITYRPDQVMHLQAEVTRLRACGWSPQVALTEGLRRTVTWFRENLHHYE